MSNHYLGFSIHMLQERLPSNNTPTDHCSSCIWLMDTHWCPQHLFLSGVLTQGDTRCEWMTFTAPGRLCGKAGVLFTSNTNSLRSLQEPPPSSCSSHRTQVKKRDLDTLIVTALSGLFSVSHLPRADLSLALLGLTDPSLAGHLDQCQTANWNVTLASFRRPSLQARPHLQTVPGGRCHKGYSHTRHTFRSYSPVCIKCHSWGFGG